VTCAEFEILVADYCDDTLLPADRAAVEEHAASCSNCREFLRDVLTGYYAGQRLAQSGAAEVQPPPELITRLAQEAPLGRVRSTAERQTWISRISDSWLRPLLQPRFAMGMAMTILSFGLLERCTGLPAQHLTPADLSPVRVWSGLETRVIRLKDRGVKYYENIRLVYEVEIQLHQLEQEQGQKQKTQAGSGGAATTQQQPQKAAGDRQQ
jgi:anti-sigma factor RsiW